MLETKTRCASTSSLSTAPLATAAPAQTTAAPSKRKQLIIGNDPISNAPFTDEDGDPSWGPVTLHGDIAWSDFERWLIVNEGRLRRWAFEPKGGGANKGQVVVYSIPTHTHEATAGAIAFSIVEQILVAGHDTGLIRSVRQLASPTCWTGDHRQEPDVSLFPVGLTVGGAVLAAAPNFPYPNIVIEVAFKNESLSRLRAKLERWMHGTSVQVAIGIKLFLASQRRVAIMHQRTRPPQRVEFGHPLDGPIQIAFPLASVYTGVALPAALAGVGNIDISIDLMDLRAVIDARLR
ncbi:hypothetical protein LEN26_011272 [Aphanomyces euteiches]|nr:hypothetical protein AeMF1_015310 [Aphanomyces euteiches]KAH9120133.1 hypothetical protein LEN26_011272 [Aphanomyces euteiches]KAH9184935.1 hypothetical protein AeNC1_013091 [Aphanomyces euteiches]